MQELKVEKKRNSQNLVIMLLSILLIMAIIYIGYDKILLKQNNIIDTKIESIKNNNNQLSISKLERDKVQKWLDDNLFIPTYIRNSEFDNQDDLAYFLIDYIASKTKGTMEEKGYTHKLSKNEAQEVINRYFGVAKFEYDFNSIKYNDSSLFITSSDENYYYVTITALDGYGDNTKLIDMFINENDEIEVIYVYLSLYPVYNNELSYLGYKKIYLKPNGENYKLLRVETNLE